MGDPTKEGKAEVYLPTSVFYNPVQEFNRDLTIAIVSQHARDHFQKLKEKKEEKSEVKADDAAEMLIDAKEKSCKEQYPDPSTLKAGVSYDNGLRILEGLAASGLRSVRFALEVPGVKQVIANDFDQNAVEFIKKNVAHNNVDHLVSPNCADATMVMHENKRYSNRFDVIDLDPYGSPAQFLDGAVQAVRDGGLLCVTCTDVAILCGNAPETCYAKYGAMPLKAKYCHEMALRIVLQSIESHANKYSRYIEPLLSISADFYIRIFARVHTGQHYVKRSVTKMSMVYQCSGCVAFHLQPIANKIQTKGDNYKFTPACGPTVGSTCRECGFKFHVGGPFWSESMHDVNFVDKVISDVQKKMTKLNTAERIVGMLSVIKEELSDVPFFYVIDQMCKIIHCTPPTLLQLRSALMNAGCEVSLSHAAKTSVKTTAPISTLWDIFRCWVKLHPVKMSNFKDGSPGKAILSKEAAIEASFEIRDDANPHSRKKGLLRWQQNPERDWGPKPRAKKGDTETLDERRLKGCMKARERLAKRKADQQEVRDSSQEPEVKKSTLENAEFESDTLKDSDATKDGKPTG